LGSIVIDLHLSFGSYSFCSHLSTHTGNYLSFSGINDSQQIGQ